MTITCIKRCSDLLCTKEVAITYDISPFGKFRRHQSRSDRLCVTKVADTVLQVVKIALTYYVLKKYL